MLVEMLIAQMCVGLIGQPHAACIHAAEATAIQYQIKQDVGSAENVTRDLAQRKIETVTGKEALIITLFTVKVIRDKEVSARLLRGGGMVPSVNINASREKGSFRLGWSF